MTKKIWTASSMGKKGIRAMVEMVGRDTDRIRKLGKAAKEILEIRNDEERGRRVIAEENKQREGAAAGGRPAVYEGNCTSVIPYGKNKGKLRGRHRFNSKGVCSCGARRAAEHGWVND